MSTADGSQLSAHTEPVFKCPQAMSKSHFGLIGLGVMGENLVLNAESNGFSSVVYNRTYAKTEEFLKARGSGKNIQGATDLKDFVEDFLKDSLKDFLKDFLRHFLKDFLQHFLKDFHKDFLKHSLKHSLTDFLKDFLKGFLKDFLQDFLEDFLMNSHKDWSYLDDHTTKP